MAERLAPPDITSAFIGHLSGLLAVPVSSATPNPRPDEFVTVNVLGGAGRTNVVTYRASVTYEAWAQTEPAARDLAHQARTELLALGATVHDGVTIYSVTDVGAPGTLPDPVSAQHRWVGTIEATVRETSA